MRGESFTLARKVAPLPARGSAGGRGSARASPLRAHLSSCPPPPRRRAAAAEVEEFFKKCDPEKENLCLYGHADATWVVDLPAEEVPPELPEPALGINFARDGMMVRPPGRDF